MDDRPHTMPTLPAYSYPLDTLETTPHIEPPPWVLGHEDAVGDVGVIFRHSGWQTRRDCVASALARMDDAQNRLTRFRCCGRNCWVLRSADDPNVYRLSCDKCKDRFCDPCSAERARRVASCVAEFAGTRELRLITLTLRKSDRTLTEDIDRLYAGFTRLRRRRVWTKGQRGGVFFIEVKRRRGNDGWHVHLHILAEGTWIDKKKIKSAWLQITGDSFIIDVKYCESGADAARYVAKYASKGVHGSCYHDPYVLQEAMEAIKGRRLVGKYGTWRGLDLNDTVEVGNWIGVAPLHRILADAATGDPQAVKIIDNLLGEQTCNTSNRSPPDRGQLPS